MEIEKLNKRIMIVDDEESIANSLAVLLAGEGYKVIAVFNGHEALAKLNEGVSVDLIICDIMMPVMTGWELCQELQAHPVYQNIPFVVMSISISFLAFNKASYKYDAFIKKPFDFDELVQVVEKLVNA